MAKPIEVFRVQRLNAKTVLAHIKISIADLLEGEEREHFLEANFRVEFEGGEHTSACVEAVRTKALEIFECAREVIKFNELTWT